MNTQRHDREDATSFARPFGRCARVAPHGPSIKAPQAMCRRHSILRSALGMRQHFVALLAIRRLGLTRANAFAVLIAALIAVLGMGITPARAQSGLTPEQLQALFRKASPDEQKQLEEQFQRAQPTQQATPQAEIVMKPAPQPSARLGGSRIESILSSRAGMALRQFGYNEVGVGNSVTVPEMGAVQSNYILGPGDSISVTLRGQENSTYTVTVDRNGQVVFPKLNPIPAAGRTFDEFRRDLVAAVHHFYTSTEVFAAVSALRQISVLVSGEVANPGQRLVTGLSSPLDAILLSGGVKKSGSLRDIKVIRGNHMIPVDLYDILTQHGSAQPINLRDGDRVVVPPIGVTVAVGGDVRRPAIYELAAHHDVISVRSALALASGPDIRGVHRVSIIRIMADGRRQYVDVTDNLDTPLRDGEVVVLRPAVNVSIGQVTLVGAMRTPGRFALNKYRTLHDLIPNADALQPDAYLLFGFINRIDPGTLQHTVVPFSVLKIIRGQENVQLMNDDIVHVLTRTGMRGLIGNAVPEPSSQPQPSQGGQSAGSAVTTGEAERSSVGAETGVAGTSAPVPPMGTIVSTETAETTEAATAGQPTGAAGTAPSANGEGESASNAADLGGYSSEDAAFFGKKLRDYQAVLTGAVNHAGSYLVAPDTTLAELIVAAGGLDSDVDLKNFELTSTVIDNAAALSTTVRTSHPATQAEFLRIVLKPYDRITFRHVYSDREGGSVAIEGEIHYPGSYDVMRGERLSSLLRRAGGLTPLAYADGTVFLRSSVARQQAAENRQNVADMRSQLFTILMRPSATATPAPASESIAALQALLTQMESVPALGRISIVADPMVLAKDPTNDPVLQSGDRIVIPKRPSSVMVLGEVLRPGNFPAKSSVSVDEFIEDAGGFTQFADTSRVIVVLPSGKVRSGHNSWISFGADEDIPAGSVVVVPRDMSTLSLHQLIVDTTGIFSQLATTAAALAVLSKY